MYKDLPCSFLPLLLSLSLSFSPSAPLPLRGVIFGKRFSFFQHFFATLCAIVFIKWWWRAQFGPSTAHSAKTICTSRKIAKIFRAFFAFQCAKHTVCLWRGCRKLTKQLFLHFLASTCFVRFHDAIAVTGPIFVASTTTASGHCDFAL